MKNAIIKIAPRKYPATASINSGCIITKTILVISNINVKTWAKFNFLICFFNIYEIFFNKLQNFHTKL